MHYFGAVLFYGFVVLLYLTHQLYDWTGWALLAVGLLFFTDWIYSRSPFRYLLLAEESNRVETITRMELQKTRLNSLLESVQKATIRELLDVWRREEAWDRPHPVLIRLQDYKEEAVLEVLEHLRSDSDPKPWIALLPHLVHLKPPHQFKGSPEKQAQWYLEELEGHYGEQ